MRQNSRFNTDKHIYIYIYIYIHIHIYRYRYILQVPVAWHGLALVLTLIVAASWCRSFSNVSVSGCKIVTEAMLLHLLERCVSC